MSDVEQRILWPHHASGNFPFPEPPLAGKGDLMLGDIAEGRAHLDQTIVL
jgi:hypothetical protein